jgi:hypothetical protein
VGVGCGGCGVGVGVGGGVGGGVGCVFTFVYFCLLLFTFVYFCLLLFTFVYFCLLLFTFVYFVICKDNNILSKAVAPPSVLLLNMSNDPTRRTTRTTKWILEPC